MHLKQLKLAGFKSFVEPTVVSFPSSLVGVVGPNGCGKSNIIDAVRWVLGESSAKNLRGESMTDVIFNGSSGRKSVGQASVELIFDNQLGRLMGPYAQYQEIALKRIVTRDGDSTYFLNGTRCRRRDIVDIFLGTGSGARGYSIIGQGTISRLIEARPEELRGYFEEAAGISKYKDRRRETLTRLNATQENLARVADIRDELRQQLERLEQQAKAAERYKTWQEEARQHKANIVALKWRDLHQTQQRYEKEAQHWHLVQEEYQTQIAALTQQSVDKRQDFYHAQAEQQRQQQDYYQTATEVARLEETLQQTVREQQQLQQNQTQIENNLHALQQQCQQLSVERQQAQEALAGYQVQEKQWNAELEHHQQALKIQEAVEAKWMIEWQDVQTQLHQSQRDKEKAELRLQHLTEQQQSLHLRLERLTQNTSPEQQAQARADDHVLQEEQTRLLAHHQAQEHLLQQCQDKIRVLQQQLPTIEKQWQSAQQTYQSLLVQQAALHAAQQGALKTTVKTTAAWLDETNQRVFDQIEVKAPWLSVAEWLLSDSLQAVIVPSVTELGLKILQAEGAFVELHESLPTGIYPRLSDYIVGKLPAWNTLFTTIYAATTLAEALTWLPTIQPHESIMTTEGVWLGVGWVRVMPKKAAEQAGFLARKKALDDIEQQLVIAQKNQDTLFAQRQECIAQQSLLESERQQAQQTAKSALEACHQINVRVQTQQHLLQQLIEQEKINQSVRVECETTLENYAQIQYDTEQALQQATQRYQQAEQQVLVRQTEKKQWEETLKQLRDLITPLRQQLQTLQIQQQRETLLLEQNVKQQQREEQMIRTEAQALQALQQRLHRLPETENQWRAQLEEKLNGQLQRESQLQQHRMQVDELQNALQMIEQTLKETTLQANQSQAQAQEAHIQAQAQKERLFDLEEALQALGYAMPSFVPTLHQEMHPASEEMLLKRLEEKIKRLGAINLLAIEEYDNAQQRHQHLDTQYADLHQAMTTLHQAIVKMDKETEQRFQETFEQVNELFRNLFPRLFGGGSARLQLTCDNLLEAGILVSAQPPGKRNQTLQVLSGGEKALTAVALVFAFFQLNPSPFCMLDEVDAPLDEANVRRFCDLVREMSASVQFLLITHNKTTMTLADYLIGVTMREPGVSRIVGVDMASTLQSIQTRS